MAPPATARMKLDAEGVDAICARIAEGMPLSGIAADVGVSIGALSEWIGADAERSARVRETRARTAWAWDEKAEEKIDSAKDAFELSRAKELAHHWRWRASKIAPREYGDQVTLHHEQGATEADIDARIASVELEIASILGSASAGPTDGREGEATGEEQL